MVINSSFIVLVFSVFVASVSQILLKKSALMDHPSLIKEYLNPYVIAGYGLLVASTVLTIIAFSKIDYKNGPIVESLGYIFVMFMSLIFFNEKITKKKLIGNLLILLGIFIFYI